MSRIISVLMFLFLTAALSGGSPFALAKEVANSSKRHDIQSVKTSGFSFLVEPTPTWVVAAKAGSNTQLPRSSMHYEIIDDQDRVDRDSVSFYKHIVRVVDEPTGLDTASQIQIDFDPAYQVLVLHEIKLWRGGRRIDKLDRKKVRLLQRETQLESRVYDGRVTASIVLDDVRVGDRIDYAFSLRGINPVFEGKFVTTEWMLAEKGPIAVYQYRLLSPENRPIAYRAGEGIKVTSGTHSGMREMVFRRIAVPQAVYDPYAPETAYLADQVQLSEFASWNEVAKWGERIFASSAVPSESVRQRADEIRRTAATPSERLQHALDFVQTEVRYFGTEIGPNSHRPAMPETVINQRLGDCKDKTSLLIALLKELSIEAAPVFVSTHYRDQVDSMLPSPLAFDHAIARAELDGKVYWLDGTRSHQTGTLLQRMSVGLGKALVASASTQNLVALPGTTLEERISVDDTFLIQRFSEDPLLESRITYYGELAESLRNAIASQPISQIQNLFISAYSPYYPNIRSTSAARIEEIPDQNALRLVQQFTVPQFWRFPEQRQLVGDVGFWNIVAALRYPGDPMRKLPFRIQSPGIYRQSIVFDYPEDVYKTSSSSHFDDGDPHFQYHVEYDTTPRRVKLSAELHLLKDSVATADWPAYTDKLVKLRGRFAPSVAVPALSLAQIEKLQLGLHRLDMKRGGIDKLATPVQKEARVRQLILAAQLDGGRLNPALRAQALREHGIQLDHLGLYDSAAADFDEALRLSPNDADTYTDAAENAFFRGQDALAAERARKALQLAPSNSSPRSVLARANYYSKNYSEAKQDLLDDLKVSRDRNESGYAAIWLYLTARHMGEDGVAAIKPYLPSETTSRWPYPILQFFVGAGDFEQALKAAKEEANNPSRLCELYFYAGERYLLDGDKSRAKKYFQKSIDTGVVEFIEYPAAKRSITALDEN